MRNRCFMPLAATLALFCTILISTVSAQSAEGPAGGLKRTFDFGDHSSAFLVEKAWKALEVRDHPAVMAYVNMCIELYQETAIKQQLSLTAPIPVSEKERVHSYAALNDVGTAYFILGQLHERRGDTAAAVEAYKFVAERIPFAQCWDAANGWFWRPSDASRARIRALEFETVSR